MIHRARKEEITNRDIQLRNKKYTRLQKKESNKRKIQPTGKKQTKTRKEEIKREMQNKKRQPQMSFYHILEYLNSSLKC